MSASSRLSVNVNAVAMLRNRRDLPWPSVVGLARTAMRAGAKGVTAHPRPDERHIRRADVADLAALIDGEFTGKELCLEGFPDDVFLEFVERHRPHQVLFVPDGPGQSTSDHGWDFERDAALLARICGMAKGWNVRVALFADPDPAAAHGAREAGADRIEIYTGPYGACFANPTAEAKELDRIAVTAAAAHSAGLGVNAGHDLTLANLPELAKRVPKLREVSIGHGFTADALIYGFEETVRRYRRVLGEL